MPVLLLLKSANGCRGGPPCRVPRGWAAPCGATISQMREDSAGGKKKAPRPGGGKGGKVSGTGRFTSFATPTNQTTRSSRGKEALPLP